MQEERETKHKGMPGGVSGRGAGEEKKREVICTDAFKARARIDNRQTAGK